MIETAQRHFNLLGLSSGCSSADARTAYRRLAKENHPDLFPSEHQSRQQLRMMRINEAYMAVLAALAEREWDDPERHAGAAASPEATDSSAAAEPGSPSAETAVGSLRDPAYAYYKQGFRYFNLGSTELFRKEAPKIRRYLETEGSADGYILRLALRALHYFERSYSYFLVVAEQYASSPWAADARWKLRRLEKFSAIYQRICENLSRRSSTRRSSFSMVSGAEPSK